MDRKFSVQKFKAWFPYNRNRRKSAQDSVPALSGVGAVNMPQTPQIECFHLIYLSAALESDWASWPVLGHCLGHSYGAYDYMETRL